MATILVTGGSGLVGRGVQSFVDSLPTGHILAKKLRSCNIIYLSSRDCDLTDREATIRLFTAIRPTYVIHLAAKVGGLFLNMSQKVDMFGKNMRINMNVLEASHLVNAQKVVSCLSTCIFPDKTTYPIHEGMLHLGPPHSSNDAYAYAKRMLDVLSRAYNEQYGRTRFVCVIPTNIYGPHDNFDLEAGHVIPALIHRCYKAINEGTPFVVAGSGAPLRQFLYSKDLGHLLMRVLFDYDSSEPLILSPSERDEVSIGWIADRIARLFGGGPVVFDETRPDGQFKKTADNTRLRSVFPDVAFTPLETGLDETVAWFCQNASTFRGRGR